MFSKKSKYQIVHKKKSNKSEINVLYELNKGRIFDNNKKFGLNQNQRRNYIKNKSNSNKLTDLNQDGQYNINNIKTNNNTQPKLNCTDDFQK